ncbi:MAG: sulfurtransferase [Myxococcota bacterium]
MLSKMLAIVGLSLALGCGDGGSPDSQPPDSQPTDSPIVVSVDWLADNLSDPNLQLVDARAGTAFEEGRIPNAIQLLPPQLATPEGDVPSQVAPPGLAEPVLRAAGLREGTTVVVYGEPPEFDPARIVWTLRYYQHGDVRYLDGGYPAWLERGGEIDDGPPSSTPTDYTIDGVDEDLRVTSDFVLSSIGEAPYAMPSIQLVDARSPGEFAAGRIPTASLVQWTDNLEDGLLRSLDDIAALHEGLDPGVTTVTYCLIGWRGSVAWLALTHLGYEDVRLYDGSWAEWGSSAAFPVEQ